MAAAPLADSTAAESPAASGDTTDVELDEQYLRSLHIDNLCALLDRYGVSIPDHVDANSAKAIVDYIVSEYAV